MNVARRYPRFRRLLASLAVSQAGDWLYNLALLAFVYERTHSSAWLGVTTAARVLPIVVCGPLGGVLADRYDRRRLMLASDAARFVLMLGLALVAAAGLPVVLAPIIAALATAASSAYIPSVAATTPRLVDDADLPAANAARSVVQQVCIVAGPGFGALLLLIGPPSLAFAINGATFALSALAVASIPAGAIFAPGGDAEAAPNVLRELRDGARALLDQPVAMRLIGADLVCSAIYGAETVLLLLLSRELGLGDHGYGYLLASFGLGGVLGAGVAGRAAASERAGLVVVGAMAAIAACTALFADPFGVGGALALGVV
jgi:MFS family permease